MLSFNSLLKSVHIDPAAVRLVRHKHGREYQRQLYQDAIFGSRRFEQYQAGQGNPNVVASLRSAQVLASFVVGPAAETVFVGLWRVLGCDRTYTPDPYYADPPPPDGHEVTFQLEAMPELAEYRGRIVVDWGLGGRAWVQRAARQDKVITELRREAQEPPFPGFARFDRGLHEIDGLPQSWLAVLQSTRGIYLIVHRESGLQYIGAAIGADGFLGRWRCYANGHGGNVGLRELAQQAREYDVRILETVGSTATTEDLYALEAAWKQKLGSRVRGLNRN